MVEFRDRGIATWHDMDVTAEVNMRNKKKFRIKTMRLGFEVNGEVMFVRNILISYGEPGYMTDLFDDCQSQAGAIR